MIGLFIALVPAAYIADHVAIVLFVWINWAPGPDELYSDMFLRMSASIFFNFHEEGKHQEAVSVPNIC